MKYTRYIYGNKKRGIRGKNALIIIGLLVVAILTGTIFSRFFIKDSIKENDTDSKSIVDGEVNRINSVDTQNKPKIYAIQCGYFAKKENVDELLGKLKLKHGGFFVEDGNKFRVFVGIYEEDKIEEKIKEVSADGFSGMKVDVTSKPNKGSYSELYEILVAQIKLLNKLDDKNIKSINTDEFKKWVEEIKAPSESNIYYKQFSEAKKLSINLPKDLTKEKKDELYKSIYSILKSIK